MRDNERQALTIADLREIFDECIDVLVTLLLCCGNVKVNPGLKSSGTEGRRDRAQRRNTATFART